LSGRRRRLGRNGEHAGQDRERGALSPAAAYLPGASAGAMTWPARARAAELWRRLQQHQPHGTAAATVPLFSEPLVSVAAPDVSIRDRHDGLYLWQGRAGPWGARDQKPESRKERRDRQEAVKLAAPDPSRALPRRYEDDVRQRSGPPPALPYRDQDPDTPKRLAGDFRAAVGPGPSFSQQEVIAFFAGLPPLLRRDLLAALSLLGPAARTASVPGPGSVAVVLHRAALLVEKASRASEDPCLPFPDPGKVLTKVDADFLAALAAEAVSCGGQVLTPPVPQLPSWVADADLLSAFGWLRLAFAPSSGSKWHRPGCDATPETCLATDDHQPWWRVSMASAGRLCTVCGGPGIKHLAEVTQLVAAADVWDARGRDSIEPWQRMSVARLQAATMMDRAAAAEPDITLAARVVAALVAEQPGQERSGDSRAIDRDISDPLADSDALDAANAGALAVRRLNTVSELLPPWQRPDVLPDAAAPSALAERLDALCAIVDLPRLDRLLFPAGPAPAQPNGASGLSRDRLVR
jgi:hypothetical protein